MSHGRPDSIDELNDALTKSLHAQVEQRAHEWLVSAKGADWTALFEETKRRELELSQEVARLRVVLRDIEIGLGLQDYSTVFPKPETDLEKVLLEHLYRLSEHAKKALGVK